jgi:hypothetical protein
VGVEAVSIAPENQARLRVMFGTARDLVEDGIEASADGRWDLGEVLSIVVDLGEAVAGIVGVLSHLPRPTPEERKARKEARVARRTAKRAARMRSPD